MNYFSAALAHTVSRVPILALFVVLIGSGVRAQDCGNISDAEMVFEGGAEATTVRIYDPSGSPVSGTVTGTSTTTTIFNVEERPGDCDLFLGLRDGLTHNMETDYYMDLEEGPHVFVIRNGGTVLGTFTRGRRYASSDSFFLPDGSDAGDSSILIRSSGIRISPVQMWVSSGPDRYMDEFFSHDDWLWPYHAEHICSQMTCTGEPGSGTKSGGQFLAQQGTVGANTTFRVGAPSIQRGSSANDTWNDPGLTLEFDVEVGLETEGTLDVTGVTFTSSGSRWEGIDFKPGSDGSLTNVNVLNAHRHLTGYSIVIDDASPDLNDVKVVPPDPSNAAGGIRITGSQASPELDGVEVEDVTYHGIVVDNLADAHITDSFIERTRYRGLTAGYGTDVFLYPEQPSGTVGTQITFSGDEGVSASSNADVVFGYYYYPSQYWRPHVDGFNSVLDSGDEGIEATSSAAIYAGSGNGGTNNTDKHQRNRLYDNTGDDARASGSGSAVYARCNWWNDTTPPFRTNATSGGYLDDSLWLEEDPYVNPSTPCVSSSGARMASSRPSDRLSDAVATLGRPAEALVSFASLITDESDTPEAAAAMAQVSRLARRADDEAARAGAEGLLSTYADAPGPLRSIARRGLALVRHERGDLNGSLDLLGALLTDADKKDDALYAYTARVYVLSDLGREAEARAAYDEILRLAPGSPQEDLAREHVGLPYQPETRRRIAEATKEEGRSVLAQVSMSPNPARGMATLTFVVASSDAVHVRAAVYDMLGREVATVANGPFGPGTHSASVDVSVLSPGLYVVRAEAASGAGPTTFSESFTVVR